MGSTSITTVSEIEHIENNDALHDFGAVQASRGSDFHHFWIISRLIELEEQKAADYVLLCEYVEDLAELDSSETPTSIRLYQLKKKESGNWQAHNLTGQTLRNKTPKLGSPILKLFKNVRSFKQLKASGVFMTNGSFQVSLNNGGSSLHVPKIGMHDLDPSYAGALKSLIAAAERVDEDQVDLSAVELHRTTLAIGDIENHVKGLMLDHLSRAAPDHAAQATSLVESLYVRIKRMARRTEKSPDWHDLVDKRGFRRAAYVDAVQSLQALPDKVAIRQGTYERLSAHWLYGERAWVLGALNQCARDKVVAGTGNRWVNDAAGVAAICSQASSEGECFEQLCIHLAGLAPALSSHEIKALAIYEMTEWTLNPTRD